MDIDPRELIKSDDDPRGSERRNALLNTLVAITVSVLATFMGICKVKDDNIVQAMQQAQADKLDHWNFYQARNIRQDVAEAATVQFRLAKSAARRRRRRPPTTRRLPSTRRKQPTRRRRSRSSGPRPTTTRRPTTG